MRVRRVVENAPLIVIIILINLAGTLVGFFYYWDQISTSSPSIWLFIPDCPLYVLLAAIVLALYLTTKRRSDLVNFITAIGLLKYGTWTALVVLGFSTFYFAIDSALYGAIAIMHIGMALEFVLPLFLIRRVQRGFVVLALLWFFANDIADYYFAAHPPIPINELTLIAPLTFALTPLCTLIAYFGARYLSNNKTHKNR
ncbi:MAG: DUF1405 domain-containing protein [Euryarchaeota archaeon]|nr:DUF1405 domain-containing protein [Euryarchaeota archaeon]